MNSNNINNASTTSSIHFEIKSEPKEVDDVALEVVEDYVIGHRSSEEAYFCSFSTEASGYGHKLISGPQSQIWPCWKYRDSATMTDDAVPISPTKVGEISTSNGEVAPMYLVGYFGGKPVYRTTAICAQENSAHRPGSFEWHWPAIFPNKVVTGCSIMQADVTIRDKFSGVVTIEKDRDYRMDSTTTDDDLALK